MIIFKDKLTNQEVFCDSYKFKYDPTCEAFIVPSKMEMICNDVQVNIGANPSAEEEEEQYESDAPQKKFKIADHYGYDCCEDFKAKSYKEYAASLQAHYKEHCPEKLDEMKEAFNKFIQFVVKKKKADPDCCIDLFRQVNGAFDGYMPIFVWEGGEEGSFYYFKYALEEEKC